MGKVEHSHRAVGNSDGVFALFGASGEITCYARLRHAARDPGASGEICTIID
jgi:hypothetical protein